jgi:hypothetical protein
VEPTKPIDIARSIFANPAHHRLKFGGLRQQLQGVGVEEAPGIGQLERPGVALEQQHAQRLSSCWIWRDSGAARYGAAPRRA